MGQKTKLAAISGKYWGTNQCIFESPYTETHVARIKAGGFSSKHFHKKNNRFYVVEGKIEVIVYNTKGEEKVTLGPTQMTDVPGGMWHRFNVLEDSIIVENYWVDELDLNDIQRADDGGLNTEFDEMGEKLKNL